MALDAMDRAVGAVGLVAVAALYFFFWAEALHILHMLKWHWHPRRMIQRLPPVADLCLACAGGALTVVVVEWRRRRKRGPTTARYFSFRGARRGRDSDSLT